MNSTLPPHPMFDESERIPQSVPIMRRFSILLVMAGASLAALAQTNAPEVRKMSLADCIQGSLQSNLDLQVSRYAIPQAQQDLERAYAGYDPTFSISGRHNFNRSGGGIDPNTHLPTPANQNNANSFNTSMLNGLLPWGTTYNLQGGVSENYGRSGNAPYDQSSGSASANLTQPLLKNSWIDQTRMNVRVAKNNIQYSELGWKQTVMTTVTAVEQAYYDLIYARENVKVQEKAVELAEQLVAENRKRVEVGALAPLDEKQAESQAATSQAALIAAKSALAVQENQLKQLLSDNFAAWENVDIQPTITLSAPVHTFDLQKSWGIGLRERPDLLQAKLNIESQGITLKWNYNQLFPQLDIVGGYGHNAGANGNSEFSDAFNRLREGSQPNYYYGGQLTIPLANIASRAAYKKSKLTMQTYELDLKKLEQSIMATIDNDIKQSQSSYEQVAATHSATAYAEDALIAEQKKLEQGKSTTYTVLQMQRDLTTARGNEIQALTTYNKNLSQLSLDEGTTLDRLHIDLQVKTSVPWP
jgi:outer membrane protein